MVFIIIKQKASLMKTGISMYDHKLSICLVIFKISYSKIIKGNSQHSILYSIVNRNKNDSSYRCNKHTLMWGNSDHT